MTPKPEMPKTDKYDEARMAEKTIRFGKRYGKLVSAGDIALPSAPSEPAPSSEKALTRSEIYSVLDGWHTTKRGPKWMLRADQRDDMMRTFDALLSSSPAPSESPQSAPEAMGVIKKGCITCLHGKLGLYEGPCKECSEASGWHNWKPKRSEP